MFLIAKHFLRQFGPQITFKIPKSENFTFFLFFYFPFSSSVEG